MSYHNKYLKLTSVLAIVERILCRHYLLQYINAGKINERDALTVWKGYGFSRWKLL